MLSAQPQHVATLDPKFSAYISNFLLPFGGHGIDVARGGINPNTAADSLYTKKTTPKGRAFSYVDGTLAGLLTHSTTSSQYIFAGFLGNITAYNSQGRIFWNANYEVIFNQSGTSVGIYIGGGLKYTFPIPAAFNTTSIILYHNATSTSTPPIVWVDGNRVAVATVSASTATNSGVWAIANHGTVERVLLSNVNGAFFGNSRVPLDLADQIAKNPWQLLLDSAETETQSILAGLSATLGGGGIVNINATSSANFAGSALSNVTFVSNATSGASFTGTSLFKSTFVSNATSTTNFTGSSLFNGVLVSNGSSAISFVGVAGGGGVINSDFSINGSSAVSFTGSSLFNGVLVSNAISTASFTGSSLFKSVLTSQGVGLGSFTGTAAFNSAFSSVGVSTNSFTGKALSSAVFASNGISAANFITPSASNAVFSIAASSTASFVAFSIDKLPYLPLDPYLPISDDVGQLKLRLYDLYRQIRTHSNKMVDEINRINGL